MTFEDRIYYERLDATHSTTLQCILSLLEDYGSIPDELTKTLENEKDITVLTTWHKLAAKANSIEEFQKLIHM